METNIYKVSGGPGGYDTYDSFICYAKTKEEAKDLHPSDTMRISEMKKDDNFYMHDWTPDTKTLTVELLGKAYNRETKVILASFNAG